MHNKKIKIDKIRKNRFAATWVRFRSNIMKVINITINNPHKYMTSLSLSNPNLLKRLEQERAAADRLKVRFSRKCVTIFIKTKPCLTVTFEECLVYKMCSWAQSTTTSSWKREAWWTSLENMIIYKSHWCALVYKQIHGKYSTSSVSSVERVCVWKESKSTSWYAFFSG